jgi:hypothetical protein
VIQFIEVGVVSGKGFIDLNAKLRMSFTACIHEAEWL